MFHDPKRTHVKGIKPIKFVDKALDVGSSVKRGWRPSFAPPLSQLSHN